MCLYMKLKLEDSQSLWLPTCVLCISILITAQLKDQSHTYIYLQKYFNIFFFDKHASHNFKYLYLFQVLT